MRLVENGSGIAQSLSHAHTNRFDNQVAPWLQFFLNYYFAILVGLGLGWFGWLWYRDWRRRRLPPKPKT